MMLAYHSQSVIAGDNVREDAFEKPLEDREREVQQELTRIVLFLGAAIIPFVFSCFFWYARGRLHWDLDTAQRACPILATLSGFPFFVAYRYARKKTGLPADTPTFLVHAGYLAVTYVLISIVSVYLAFVLG